MGFLVQTPDSYLSKQPASWPCDDEFRATLPSLT